jgi:hypothetical protein
LNLKKTGVRSTVEQVNILADGKEISTITSYKFLWALITNDGYTKYDIRRRLSLGKTATAELSKIMRDPAVLTNTKVKLLQTTAIWM